MTIAAAYREHYELVWGLCYRMTGSAADADELAQETFVRAVERPPRTTSDPLAPWLATVALNLSRDRLRHRKERPYVGPWLPAPVPTNEEASPEEDDPAVRYDRVESASFAFLVALEALTPTQRAVTVLRDVLDYSVNETAACLGISEGNVKVTHLRARRALETYDATRVRPTRTVQGKTKEILMRFVIALETADAAALEALLSPSAEAATDGGGEFLAAVRRIVGRDRVARFCLGLAKKAGRVSGVEMAMLNGLPAVVFDWDAPERYAPRFVLQCVLDRDGMIRDIYGVLASPKLSALTPPASRCGGAHG